MNPSGIMDSSFLVSYNTLAGAVRGFLKGGGVICIKVCVYVGARFADSISFCLKHPMK